jgi:glyoxylase-like metal-dependent hydrolase (beta-lactamase superfamily II)
LRVGPYEVESIIDGHFGLDGGAMFGIVPRPLWERSNPPDARNRIELVARCLLIRGNERCVLIETGIGDKFDEKRTDIFAVRHPGGGLVKELARRGVAPEQVTDVVLTHLHFDHCGGTTRRASGGLELTFPAAEHHLQRRQWERAQAPSEKDAGSFRREDFEPLSGAALHLLDGECEILEGIAVHPVNGHTEGMQLVSIRDRASRLLFCADLVPTKTHLRWPYIMAYDNEPLVTLAEKKSWLPRAAADGDVVVFGHDPACDAVRLQGGEAGVTVAAELDLRR